MKNHSMVHKKQSGSVLMVSLIILISLTLLVLSGSQTVVVQEKMTFAVRDAHIAMEIAESGIRDAEEVLEAFTDMSPFNDAGTNGFYSEGNGPQDLFASTTWVDGVINDATTAVSGENAQYFIEYLGQYEVSSSRAVNIIGYGEASEEDEVYLFKIVARSLGLSGNTERIVVSHYAKSF